MAGIKDRLKSAKSNPTPQNSTASLPQTAEKAENKLNGLSQQDLVAVSMMNTQTATQMYGVNPHDMVVQVRNNLQVQLKQNKVHQFTEESKPNKDVGQHYYVPALPMNANIAPTSRSFMPNSDFTPLDNFGFLQEKGLQFNYAVVSAMIDYYQNKANNINISEIFAQFKEKEGWVLNEESDEVKHFFNELARIFNCFSKNEAPIGSFVNINNNALYLIILFDMLNIEYFALLYNWIVAQDVQAMHNLLRRANHLFEEYRLQKKKENYTQTFSENEIRQHDLFMKSIYSLYERIRYFQKWSVVNSVFGEKNQEMIQSFVSKISHYSH